MTSRYGDRILLVGFHRLDVDWKLHGYDATALKELAEMTLRTVQS